MQHRFSRISTPFLRLLALTFISSLLASGFICLLIFQQKSDKFNKFNLLEMERKYDVKTNPIFLLDIFQGRIKHVKKNETTEDHCVLYNFVKATHKKPSTYEPISLALHSSVSYASHIISQAKSWNDFISYSIYLYPGDEQILVELMQLHTCHSEVRGKVSMHLVWNRGLFQMDCLNPSLMKALQRLQKVEINCREFSIPKFVIHVKSFSISLDNYPINIMRNEAHRGAITKLHLVADIETKFSTNFAKNIRNLTQNLLNNAFGKVVLVFRRFEIFPEIPFPQSPAEVKVLLKEKKLFPFHWYFFKQGHRIPHLSEWMNYSVSSANVTFSNLPYLNHEWEPQFIMLDLDPYHLEFVPTRFNDHQTLCNQLCRANYKYLVMTHVYNIHPGIKRHSTPIELALSRLGRKKARGILRKFNEFLDMHYPNSGNSCPKIKY